MGDSSNQIAAPIPRSMGAVAEFPTTRWSLVVAINRMDAASALKALSELCQDYWYPLYAYARRRGLSPQDAEDRTQDFFQSLIKHESLTDLVPERGRLRSYFMTAMKNFIAKEHRRQTAEKRGGAEFVVSIDQAKAERRLAGEPSDHRSPDALFDQSWAYAVLDGAMNRLANWYALRKRADLFQAIREFIAGHHGDKSYVEVSERLGVSEPTLRAAIHQMRKRYRGMIEEEIASTVSSREETRMELEYLQQVLAGNF